VQDLLVALIAAAVAAMCGCFSLVLFAMVPMLKVRLHVGHLRARRPPWDRSRPTALRCAATLTPAPALSVLVRLVPLIKPRERQRTLP